LLKHYLSPAWFDEARRIVQEPRLAQVLGSRTLEGRVLNAGCGEGLYAPFIEGFTGVRRILNMDLSRPAVARRRSDRRHSDQQGSLTALPYLTSSLDAVVCSEVLEHVPDDRLAAAELARVLRPGGLLLLSVPTLPAPRDSAHVREGYTLEQLQAVLVPAGFDIVASRRCMHAWMRALYNTWQWQHRLARRNIFPRGALRAAARLDLATGWGKPWDLVILAVRTGSAPR
jgi:SAM-dependent methyltransferase